jgi:hypothetical protein
MASSIETLGADVHFDQWWQLLSAHDLSGVRAPLKARVMLTCTAGIIASTRTNIEIHLSSR